LETLASQELAKKAWGSQKPGFFEKPGFSRPEDF
jgi:hypothetical protein